LEEVEGSVSVSKGNEVVACLSPKGRHGVSVTIVGAAEIFEARSLTRAIEHLVARV
jgi:hypothetical protein